VLGGVRKISRIPKYSSQARERSRAPASARVTSSSRPRVLQPLALNSRERSRGKVERFEISIGDYIEDDIRAGAALMRSSSERFNVDTTGRRDNNAITATIDLLDYFRCAEDPSVLVEVELVEFVECTVR